MKWMLVVLLSFAAPARGAAPEVRAAVEQLLSGYEPEDPTAGLKRLGAPAVEVLLALAQEEGRPILRLRAIEALGHVPTAAGQKYLLGLVDKHRGATESLAVFELAAAARALGAFGAVAERPLLPLLDHDSADVREGSTAGLTRIGGDGPKRALQARLLREKDRGVRRALERALQR